VKEEEPRGGRGRRNGVEGESERKEPKASVRWAQAAKRRGNATIQSSDPEREKGESAGVPSGVSARGGGEGGGAGGPNRRGAGGHGARS